jgi:tetratricopeptide (TPR) repeat protein
MGESVNSEHTIREYLLGRVADETVLEEIEERLFADEAFCSQVALAEDGIINDYVLGRLNETDAAGFQSTLATNSERRFKLELTQALREKALAKAVKVSEDKPSFFASLQSFFRQPRYVAAFAVILIAVLISAIYFSSRSRRDDLAELRSIYQQSRPTETRIAEFDYAPLTQLRGEPAPAEKNRLRRIENNLIEANEKAPNAQTHHALGVFYLTQKDYVKAIKEFESAAKLAPQNAKIHNDLGAAYFELAKASPDEKRYVPFAQALEEFTKATQLDGNLLEALFNKSLTLQEMGITREAKESWKLYLQKDSSSQWADEARKRLDGLESQKTLAKPPEQVLSDFLITYRNHDERGARQIHDETKGGMNSATLPLQLSRRYLLAKQRGDEGEAKESLAALDSIGRSEQDQHSEFFFLN